MKEPLFGYKNLIKAKKEGKVKAFFSLLIPTETIGTIELAGVKVVSGEKGYFVSLPNRAVKVPATQVVTTDGQQVASQAEEVKYYNNIRFESQDMYNSFRKVLNEEVLPLITEQLAVV